MTRGKEIRIPFPGPFRAGQKSVLETRLQIRKRQEIYLSYVFGTQYLLNAGKYIFNVELCKTVLFYTVLQVMKCLGFMLILNAKNRIRKFLMYVKFHNFTDILNLHQKI